MMEWLVVFFTKVMHIVIVILVNSIKLLGYKASELLVRKVMGRRIMVIVLLIGCMLNSDWKMNIMDLMMLCSCSVMVFLVGMAMDKMISIFIVDLMARMSKIRAVMISELVLDW